MNQNNNNNNLQQEDNNNNINNNNNNQQGSNNNNNNQQQNYQRYQQYSRRNWGNRRFNHDRRNYGNGKKNWNNDKKKKEYTEEEKLNLKETINQKKSVIDRVLGERSIFIQKKEQCEQKPVTIQRVVAHNNYSDLMLAVAAVTEYKYLISLVEGKAKSFMDLWSLPDHVFMRRMQLQMFLANQPIIRDLHQIPAIANVLNQFDEISYDFSQLPATVEFWSVFANYMATEDDHSNIQVLLPYSWRDGLGNAIGHNGQYQYDVTNNLGMHDPICFTRNQGEQQWVPRQIFPNEFTRRYDPMSTQIFQYQQTRPNNQYQGVPPLPNNISFQPPEFNENQFNLLFGVNTLIQNIQSQKTTNSQDRFLQQSVIHGVLFYNQVMKFKAVYDRFPEILKGLEKIDLSRDVYRPIRRGEDRPILWSQQANGQEQLVYQIHGSSTRHVMSPFLFQTLQNAQAWGGFFIRIGQQTIGAGDIHFFSHFNVGSPLYTEIRRIDLIQSLEKIFFKKKDDVLIGKLPVE